MAFLWKYPCGCIGAGTPATPQIQGRQSVWEDVAVVRVCDPERYCDDPDWVLPKPRILAGSVGEKPVPFGEKKEEEYFDFLHQTTRSANSWRSAKRLMKAVLED
jgi:hypothetical protein